MSSSSPFHWMSTSRLRTGQSVRTSNSWLRLDLTWSVQYGPVHYPLLRTHKQLYRHKQTRTHMHTQETSCRSNFYIIACTSTIVNLIYYLLLFIIIIIIIIWRMTGCFFYKTQLFLCFVFCHLQFCDYKAIEWRSDVTIFNSFQKSEII